MGAADGVVREEDVDLHGGLGALLLLEVGSLRLLGSSTTTGAGLAFTARHIRILLLRDKAAFAAVVATSRNLQGQRESTYGQSCLFVFAAHAQFLLAFDHANYLFVLALLAREGRIVVIGGSAPLLGAGDVRGLLGEAIGLLAACLALKFVR